MALQKQIVQVSLREGIDTKTDSKQLVNKMTTLENVTMDTLGALKKRKGFTKIASGTAANNFAASYDNELVLGDGTNFYSYDSTRDSFTTVGKLNSCKLDTIQFVSNNYDITMQDYLFDTTHSVKITVYESTQGGVFYNVMDSNTGTNLISNVLISANGSLPKIIPNLRTSPTKALIFYNDTVSGSVTLKMVAFDLVARTLGSTASLTNFYTGIYDVVQNTNVYLSYYDNGFVPGNYVVSIDPSTLVVGTPVRFSTSQMFSCAFADAAEGNLWLVSNEYDGNLYKYNFNGTTLATISKTVIEASGYVSGGPNICNIAAYLNGSALCAFYEFQSLYYSITNIDKQNNYVRYHDGTTQSTIMRSVGLASRMFLESKSNTLMCLVAHESSQQSQYFLIDSLGNIHAKIASPGNGGGLTNAIGLPHTYYASNKFYAAYLCKHVVGSSTGNIYSVRGLNEASLDFTFQVQTATIGNELHTAGAIVKTYDGQNLTEQGFNLYPENVNSFVDINSPHQGPYNITTGYNGGLEFGSTYGYRVCYEWQDANGQKHRSNPSTPIQILSAAKAITWYGQYQGLSTSNIRILNTSVLQNSDYVGIDINKYSLLFNNWFDPNSDYVSGAKIVNYSFSSGGGGQTHTLISDVAGANTAGHNFIFTTRLNRETFIATVGNGSNKIDIPCIVNPNEAIVVYGKINRSLGYIEFDSNLSKYLDTNTLLSDNLNSGSSYTITSVIGSKVYVTGLSSVGPKISLFNISPRLTYTIYGISGVYSCSATVENIKKVYENQIIGTGSFYYIVRNVNRSALTFEMYELDSGGAGPLTVGTYNHFRSIPSDWFLHVGHKVTSTTTASNTNPWGSPFTSSIRQVFTGTASITKLENIDGLIRATLDTQIVSTTVASDSGNLNSTWLKFQNFATNFVNIPTLRLTDKQNVNIVVYRTTANGTAYYRCSNISNPLFNDKTNDVITFEDTITDLELLGNEQLYTNGGEVSNISLPAVDCLSTYKNRMIAVPSESRMSWWYSKQVIPGFPSEFSDSFVQNVDSIGGFITATGVMDDKLVLFKKNHIYAVVGDGPAPTGVQNDFTPGQLVSADIGCSTPKSIVFMPHGLIFQSNKGIYLLDRSLHTQYIGKEVEAYNSTAITSAILTDNQTQIRFGQATQMIVYDYLVNQWYIYTVPSTGAAVVNGQYYVCGTTVRKESLTSYYDDLVPVSMRLKTSWINAAGLQGYERIYKALLLGDYISPHSLAVKCTYDYDVSTLHTSTISVPSFSGTNYEWRVFMARQKCTAMMIEIIETPTTDGASLVLSSIGLEIGVKRNLNKLASSRSVS